MNLIKQAIDAASEYVKQHNSVLDEARSTLPAVEVDRSGAQLVVFGYHLGQSSPSMPPGPRKIYFPFFQVAVRLPDMRVAGGSISGKFFGVETPPTEYIGDLGDLVRFGVKGYVDRRNLYFDLLSTIAEQRWLLPHAGRSAAEIESAKRFSIVAQDIAEAALEPYYRVTMRALRAWAQACQATH